MPHGFLLDTLLISSTYHIIFGGQRQVAVKMSKFPYSRVDETAFWNYVVIMKSDLSEFLNEAKKGKGNKMLNSMRFAPSDWMEIFHADGTDIEEKKLVAAGMIRTGNFQESFDIWVMNDADIIECMVESLWYTPALSAVKLIEQMYNVDDSTREMYCMEDYVHEWLSEWADSHRYEEILSSLKPYDRLRFLLVVGDYDEILGCLESDGAYILASKEEKFRDIMSMITEYFLSDANETKDFDKFNELIELSERV